VFASLSVNVVPVALFPPQTISWRPVHTAMGLARPRVGAAGRAVQVLVAGW
jgi:hypothetical protein